MLDPTAQSNKNLKGPTISFFVSLFLIFVIYFFAVKDFIVLQPIAFTLLALTVVQAVVQLIFFFHLFDEGKPRWNLLALAFTVMVIIIVIGGSMWIMSNVSYNLMPEM